MGIVIALMAGLVAAVIGAVIFLARRDRSRGEFPDDTTGMLIERQRTGQAAHLRATYSSGAVHHGTGLASDDLHKYYS
ncbi:hypothetical protein [Kitasatospora sp. SUK 42]|uniref:hypothetical protein n=1 Tax=Kitasatospora sp. SUK 42 TaxID=1588882 RepID=UPI0018CA3C65|nr:hypothetical protein [Kitasatospora sp. SUK 42]MBV2156456.1 hypothetical protein [Kitasatospora sp. SUK 42]